MLRCRCPFALVLLGLGGMLISAGPAIGQTSYELLHAFSRPGARPTSRLLQASDGNFYGTTEAGGDQDDGTIFRLDSSGTLTILHSFDCGGACAPSPLIQATDGFLYGVTFLGGAANQGSIFRISTAGAFTTLRSFSDQNGEGIHPSTVLLQAADGFLYGSAGNVFFRMSTAGVFTSFHTQVCDPSTCGTASSLVQATDGFFYGTFSGTETGAGVPNGGSVFRMNAAGAVTILRTFGAFAACYTTGCLPNDGLIQAADGFLYGVTKRGGAVDWGIIFRISTAGALTTMHEFSCSAVDGCRPNYGLVQAGDGFLYGTTQSGAPLGSTAFRMATSGAFSTLPSSFDCPTVGCLPGRFIQATDGFLYGTTAQGAAGNLGTVFKMNSAGALTTVQAFGGTAEGRSPIGGLVQAGDGRMYGTTMEGGVHGWGTVFGIDRAGVITTLHSFDCAADGCLPATALILAADGDLYGTTTAGGATNGGTFFKVTTAGEFTVLRFFDCPDELCNHQTDLVQAGDGNFYGTNQFGGANNRGFIFRITPAGAFTILHSFDCATDGCEPRAGLVEAKVTDGSLYGTASRGGGPSDGGTFFRIAMDGSLTRLRVFTCPGVCSPTTRLVQASDGLFYGTTESGPGAAFLVNGSGSVFVILHMFDCPAAEGCRPNAGLVHASDVFFYGTTGSGGGADDAGAVYRINGAGVTSGLHPFACETDGCVSSRSGLIQADDGDLYGTASLGPRGGGVVYRIGGPDPAEPSPVGDMFVSPASGTALNVAYTPACGALDHAIYWGRGPTVGVPGWTNVACNLGRSTQALFDPGTPPVGSFYYFVIVGQNAVEEGSYGRSSAGAERPQSQGLGSCDRPQVLANTCP